MFGDENFRQCDDILRLGAPEPDRFDICADFRLAERRHFFWRVGDLEQRRRRPIDPDIGRLRRQNYGDEQGEVVPVMKLGFGIWRVCRQPPEEFRRFGASHFRHLHHSAFERRADPAAARLWKSNRDRGSISQIEVAEKFRRAIIGA